MPRMKLVSEARNYTEGFKDSRKGQQILITNKGKGKYEVLDAGEYDKQQALKMLNYFYEHGL